MAREDALGTTRARDGARQKKTMARDALGTTKAKDGARQKKKTSSWRRFRRRHRRRQAGRPGKTRGCWRSIQACRTS